MTKDKQLEIQSLAVKYRPKTFSSLLGQSHIVSQITGMLEKGRLPGAILLTGLPGTGKTTLARMIARYVNCSSLKKTDKGLAPCGECRNCVSDNGLSYQEINAADNRGIDDMRALVSSSNNQTLGGGKKIICIDEFHQSTPAAAQLLLKPLEEPAKNTMWILSSMSHDKLLPAIVSRCLRLDLKQVSVEELTLHLRRICKKEKIDIEKIPGSEKTLNLICELSNCQPRAAITMLDSVILAVASNSKLDSKTLLNEVLKNTELDLEKFGAKLAASYFGKDTDNIVLAVKESKAPRALLNKTKWTCANLLDNKLKIAKFRSFGCRTLESYLSKNNVKVSVSQLVFLQKALAEAELKMNQGLDEEIALISCLIEK